MIVLVLSKCPSNLKGDVTRWLFELSPGVYVGRVSSRVREELWKKIIGNLECGRCSMVYGVDNEQRFEIRTCNSEWVPMDYDGLELMHIPYSNNEHLYVREDGYCKVCKQSK